MSIPIEVSVPETRRHAGHAVNEVILRGQVRAHTPRDRGADTMIVTVWSLTADHRNVYDTIRVRVYDPPAVPDGGWVGQWVDVRAQLRRRPDHGVWPEETVVTEGRYVQVIRRP